MKNKYGRMANTCKWPGTSIQLTKGQRIAYCLATNQPKENGIQYFVRALGDYDDNMMLCNKDDIIKDSRLTIYDIKYRHLAANPSLRMFSVHKIDSTHYRIFCPMYCRGKRVGTTTFIFDTISGKLLTD